MMGFLKKRDSNSPWNILKCGEIYPPRRSIIATTAQTQLTTATLSPAPIK
jgi:hypothetical protein